jgi:tRNA-splicing endonuclease subunit Sen2
LNREKTRRGTKAKMTSEEVTRQRRAERQQTKWERARKEREAIDQKLLEEAETTLEKEVRNDEPQPALVEVEVGDETIAVVPESTPDVVSPKESELMSPVGPLELLSLPNSALELAVYASTPDQSVVTCVIEDFDENFVDRFTYAQPVGPLELLALPNSLAKFPPPKYSPSESIDEEETEKSIYTNGHADHTSTRTLDLNTNGIDDLLPNGLRINTPSKVDDAEVVGGSETNDETIDGSTHSEDTVETNGTAPNGSALANGSPGTPKMKRQKSVRFSPTVEKNTFIQTEPPSPEHRAVSITTVEEQPLVIKDQEHTQLTLEEAFFLSYALGALEILDPETKAPIPNQELFTLFRKTSYFPPITNPSLSPDDPFMVNYVVYHHFRSLGWVPRSGVKFSVDLMLYVRGPVFTHAEFAVLILPSYSDPYWSSDVFLQKYVKSKEQRTWAWISCINRVITQVKKTLILTYVDIPPPLDKGQEEELGVDGVLCRYKVREIVMKRWIANRSRD